MTQVIYDVLFFFFEWQVLVAFIFIIIFYSPKYRLLTLGETLQMVV